MAFAHPAQVIAQMRALGIPAADAHVRVVALGEEPAVASGDIPHLEQRHVLLDAGTDVVVGDVGLERRGEDPALAELQRTAADAVGAVRCDEHLATGARAVVEGDRRPPVVLQFDAAQARAVAEVRAGERGLLGQERVEALALGHQHDRGETAVRERAEIGVAEADRRDLPFDHGADGEGQEARTAQRDAAAAGLVTRKARAVDEQRPHAPGGEQMRGHRARRARRPRR